MEGNHFHLQAIASLLPIPPNPNSLGELSSSLILRCRLELAATSRWALHLSQSFIELRGRASDLP